MIQEISENTMYKIDKNYWVPRQILDGAAQYEYST